MVEFLYIYIYNYIYINIHLNPWESNHRDGTTGHNKMAIKSFVIF